MECKLESIPSPIGNILLITEGEKVCSLDFEEYEPRMHQLLRRYHGEVALVKREKPSKAADVIQAYFAGNIEGLKNIEVAMNGTDFQQQLWQEMRKIKAGEAVSYGQLAARIGRPKAVRAVGMGNANNPVALIIPCHRVVGSSGKLTGYAGGLERKRWLLAHEGYKV